MSTTMRHRDVVTDSDEVTERPAPTARIGQVLVLGAGAVLVVAGALTLLRTGFEEGLTEPVVQVLGFSHAPWLGLAELLVGLVLVAGGAAAWNRDIGVVMGTLLVVVGVILAIDPSLAPEQLALDAGYGTFLAVVGAVALVGGLLPGGWVTTRRHRAEH